MSLDVMIIIIGALFSGVMILLTWMTNRNIQPKQLFLLFFTEMWERFSFYGMRALLILYMTNILLYPDKEANLMYGGYNALVYMMPLFGGMIADRILGFRKSIIWGGILMAIGHLVLALPIIPTFFLGLGFLIVGNGFFKPNISSYLGKYYDENDKRRDAGYNIFYMGINIGAFLGSALCGYLGQKVNWHLGFGTAGVLMIVGLITFLLNQKMLGDKHGFAPDKELLDKKTSGISTEYWVYALSILVVLCSVGLVKYHHITDFIFPIIGIGMLVYIIWSSLNEELKAKEMLWAALKMIVISVLFWGFYEQSGGSLNLMAERNVNFKVGEGNIKSSLAKDISIDTTSKKDILYLSDASSFKKGMMLQLAANSNSEINLTVDSITPDNGLVLKEKIKYNWAAGTEVKSSNTLSSAMVNNSLNPFYIILLSPLFAFMWDWLQRRNLKPSDPVKFAIAFLLLGIGYLIFYLGGGVAQYGLMPLLYFCVAYLFITLGELFLSPIGLSMVTKLSPVKMVGFMMGAWFFASAYGHHLAGWIGSKMAIPDKNTAGLPFNPVESLPIYMEGCLRIGLISLGGAIVIYLLSFIIKKWMHGVE